MMTSARRAAALAVAIVLATLGGELVWGASYFSWEHGVSCSHEK